jgi:anti-sigma regulatory factor (Ser/Thr protein kinase)
MLQICMMQVQAVCYDIMPVSNRSRREMGQAMMRGGDHDEPRPVGSANSTNATDAAERVADHRTARLAQRPSKVREMTAVTVEDLEWTALPTASLAASWRILLGSRLERAELPAELPGDILLAASELINNACEHAPTDVPISLRVRFGATWVWVGVWDSSNRPPEPKPLAVLDGDLDEVLAGLDEDGRGLRIVMALTPDRNFRWTPPRGKWVWCRFNLQGGA